MAVATQVLTEQQIRSFEQDVIAKGVKLGNWWAKQVADSLREHQTLQAKRDVIGVCLDEVRRWHPSGSSGSSGPRKPTTIEAWQRLVEDWRRGQRELR